MQGKVTFFNESKGFGFISTDDGKEYFVHKSGLADCVNISDGDFVEFEIESGDRGSKAVNVDAILEEEISGQAAYIKIVETMWDGMCKEISKDPNFLENVEWRQLECIIAHTLGTIGFTVELTQPSKDGGNPNMEETMGSKAKPGEKPPRSGEYKPVGPRGGRVNGPNVTIDGNEGHMPPTPDNGQQWERIGPAKK